MSQIGQHPPHFDTNRDEGSGGDTFRDIAHDN